MNTVIFVGLVMCVFVVYTSALPYPSEIVAESESKSENLATIATKSEAEKLVPVESAWGGYGGGGGGYGYGGGGGGYGYGGGGGGYGYGGGLGHHGHHHHYYHDNDHHHHGHDHHHHGHDHRGHDLHL